MKRSFTTLLALTAACCSIHAQEPAKKEPAANLATTPALHEKTEGRINKFNEISKKGEAQLVFLGDSITQGWEGHKAIWEAAWGAYKPANFGIGGDRTEHVLWRLDNGNFDGLKPKLVVLMIGTNNTGHRKAGEDPQHTADGVKAIIERLAKKCPDTKVLLLGIFPRGEKPEDKLRMHNAKINELLAKLADGKKVIYTDIGKKFLTEDGTLSREIMPDLLHLNAKGYQIWADALKDQVAELMK